MLRTPHIVRRRCWQGGRGKRDLSSPEGEMLLQKWNRYTESSCGFRFEENAISKMLGESDGRRIVNAPQPRSNWVSPDGDDSVISKKVK